MVDRGVLVFPWLLVPLSLTAKARDCLASFSHNIHVCGSECSFGLRIHPCRSLSLMGYSTEPVVHRCSLRSMGTCHFTVFEVRRGGRNVTVSLFFVPRFTKPGRMGDVNIDSDGSHAYLTRNIDTGIQRYSVARTTIYTRLVRTVQS